jgi:hypothetical protein
MKKIVIFTDFNPFSDSLVWDKKNAVFFDFVRVDAGGIPPPPCVDLRRFPLNVRCCGKYVFVFMCRLTAWYIISVKHQRQCRAQVVLAKKKK